MRLLYLATALSILSLPYVFKATKVTYYRCDRGNVAIPVGQQKQCHCTIKIDTTDREIVISDTDGTAGEYFHIDSTDEGWTSTDTTHFYECTQQRWIWKEKRLVSRKIKCEFRFCENRGSWIALLWGNLDSMRIYEP